MFKNSMKVVEFEGEINRHDLDDDDSLVKLDLKRAHPGLVVHLSEMFKTSIKVVEFEYEINHHDLDDDSLVKLDLKRLSEFSDANIVLDGSLCLRDTDLG
ncbi:Hypothetical predicted protein [Olea europaea subsp. europaea]|uniref:Uncharacterized protein n=1 Tax=Olea europaea subsp. europaea TaxID=158383 RepID=A0A8S0R4L8_OLEEU|nr:Hypothetical predicted protein [Olea europaea subsp. europaea]